MNYRVFLFLALTACCLVSCDSASNLGNVNHEDQMIQLRQYQDNQSKFDDVLLESQTSFPGVQSNLKGTRKYELSFSVEVSSPLEFRRLLVDSVAVPFSALLINGQKSNGYIVESSSKLNKLTAYRNIYNNDPEAPQMVEPVVYEKTGLNLDNKAVVEYFKNDKPYYLEIEGITTLQNIYAP